MTEQANDLMTQMFTAARILNQFSAEHQTRLNRPHDAADAMAYELRTYADRWEREDAAKAEEGAIVEELAQIMYEAGDFPEKGRDFRQLRWASASPGAAARCRHRARAIIAAGYRKNGA